MIKSDLESWRFRAPFLIVSTTLIPLVYVLIKDTTLEEKIIQCIITPVSFILAFFYSAMKIRNFYWFKELGKYVGVQIKTELIKLVPEDLNITDMEKNELIQKEIWKKLTGVFWEAVDSSPELIAQKEHFYINGIYYTTSIDIILILPLISLFYIGLHLFMPNHLFLYFGICCLIVSILSRIFALPQCRKYHLELSKEQLDFLRRNKKEFISGRFKEIILEWRLEKN